MKEKKPMFLSSSDLESQSLLKAEYKNTHCLQVHTLHSPGEIDQGRLYPFDIFSLILS